MRGVWGPDNGFVDGKGEHHLMVTHAGCKEGKGGRGEGEHNICAFCRSYFWRREGGPLFCFFRGVGFCPGET